MGIFFFQLKCTTNDVENIICCTFFLWNDFLTQIIPKNFLEQMLPSYFKALSE